MDSLNSGDTIILMALALYTIHPRGGKNIHPRREGRGAPRFASGQPELRPRIQTFIGSQPERDK